MKKGRVIRSFFVWLLVFSMILSSGVNVFANVNEDTSYDMQTEDIMSEEETVSDPEVETQGETETVSENMITEKQTEETKAVQTEVQTEVESKVKKDLVSRTEKDAQSDECTITFIINGEIVKKAVIPKGALAPLYVPEDTETEPFLGWYLDGENHPFSAGRFVEEDITLTAKFSNNILITFLDTDGSELEVVEVEKDTTVNDIADVNDLKDQITPVMGKEFSYWTLANGDGSRFDFALQLTKNTVLSPKMGDLNVAIFITNGSEIDPQVVVSGNLVEKPVNVPTRNGYIFDGWYENESCTIKFDFATKEISGIQYIYAKWNVGKVDYLMNLWVKDLNGVDQLVYTKPMTGAVTESFINIVGDPEDKTSADDIVANTAGMYSKAGDSVKELLNYSTFRESDCKQKPISGTGQTVINVYYDRTVFTLHFCIDNIFNNTGSPSGKALTGAVMTTVGGETFTSGGETHTITFRYGEQINNEWPGLVNLENSNMPSQKFINWSGFWGNGERTIGFTSICVPFTSKVPMNYQGGYIKGRPIRNEVTIYPHVKNAKYSENRYYYVEISKADVEQKATEEGKTLDEFLGSDVNRTGEYAKWSATHSIYSGERYYKLVRVSVVTNQKSNPATSAKNWPGTAIPGYEEIGAKNTTCLTKDFQQVFSDKSQGLSTDHYRINYFMPEISYKLTLVMNGGTMDDTTNEYKIESGNYTKMMKYGQEVSVPDANKDNYIFAGWYNDPGHQSLYTEGTMPNTAMTLYAKYRGTEIEIIYMDNGQQINETTYAKGDYLLEYEFADDSIYKDLKTGDFIKGKGIFKGWYYNVGENISIEFPIGMVLTREKYILNAVWEPENYIVTYKESVDAEDFYEQQSLLSTKGTLAKAGYKEYAAPDKLGYIFKGWSTNPSAVKVDFNTTKKITEDITVYAVRTPVAYMIEYELNGGEVDGNNPTEYTIESNDISILNPVLKNHEFKGWKGTDLTDLETEVLISKGSYGNRMYEAIWEPIFFNGYIYKCDKDGNPLAGVVFSLKSEDGTEQFLTSAEDGKINLSIQAGTYTLVEKKTLEEYLLLDKEIVFTITDDYIIQLSESSPANTSVQNGGQELKVVNEKDPSKGYLDETESESIAETEIITESDTEEIETDETKKVNETKKKTTTHKNNNQTTKITKSSGVKTGDATQIILYLSIIIAAGMIIIGTVFNKRKLKK